MISGHFYRFPKPVVFQVSGKDSERYLQARLTNDIKRLPEQGVILAACLSPQGKTKALFRIYRQSGQEFLLIVLAGDAEQIRQDLCCFIVADRVNVRDVSSECFLVAVDSSYAMQDYAESIVVPDPYLKLNLLLSYEDFSGSFNDLEELDGDSFRLFRLKNLRPEFPEEVRVDSLFPESDIAMAISNTKGCYAGQEVVERVIALGKLPAKILIFKSEAHQESLGSSEQVSIIDQLGTKFGELLSWSGDPATKESFFCLRVPNKLIDQTPTVITAEGRRFALSLVEASRTLKE